MKEILMEYFKEYKTDYNGENTLEYWYYLTLQDIDNCIEYLSLDESDLNSDEME